MGIYNFVFTFALFPKENLKQSQKMAVLKRKKLKNKMRAIARQKSIQRLNAKPVLKNIDVQAIKASFKKDEAEGKENPAV